MFWGTWRPEVTSNKAEAIMWRAVSGWRQPRCRSGRGNNSRIRCSTFPAWQLDPGDLPRLHLHLQQKLRVHLVRTCHSILVSIMNYAHLSRPSPRHTKTIHALRAHPPPTSSRPATILPFWYAFLPLFWLVVDRCWRRGTARMKLETRLLPLASFHFLIMWSPRWRKMKDTDGRGPRFINQTQLQLHVLYWTDELANGLLRF